MKCPFKINKSIYKTHGGYTTCINESFACCDDDECPFFYRDCDDEPKCARCDGGPREEEL